MEPKKCILEIPVDGPEKFNVTIKTGDGKDDGTKSPIAMTIVGEKGTSQINILTETGANSGSVGKYTVSSQDVGQVTGFQLILENKAKWKPAEVEIVNTSNKIFITLH